MSNFRQRLLQAVNRLGEVLAVGICHADTHVSASDVLGSDLLVQSAGEDDALLQQGRQDIRRCDALGQVDSSHTVCLIFGLGGKLLQTEVGNSLLDLLRCSLVVSEALVQRT